VDTGNIDCLIVCVYISLLFVFSTLAALKCLNRGVSKYAKKQ